MLADWEIIRAQKEGKIDIDPFQLSNVNPHSYDLTLGDDFFFYYTGFYIDPRKNEERGYKETYDKFWIYPGQFILGTTVEWIRLSNGVAAMLDGKSSFARFGLAVHITGGYIDAGFSGNITLEIKNENEKCPILLRAGDLVAQLSFFAISKSEIPYNMKKTSKYNGQRGTTPSRYHLNEWYG